MRALSAAERAAWERLAEAEQALREAREHVMRVTNLEHARRSRRLRPVPSPPGAGLRSEDQQAR